MIVAIHQPNYFPWLGYFYKIYQSDQFIFLDDVQFSNKGMHNYHYVKTPQGSFRLKVPVSYNTGDRILQVKTKDHLGWRKKHLKTIEMNYKKSPFFSEVFADLSSLMSSDISNLSMFNQEAIRFFSTKLGISVKFLKSSDYKIESSKAEKILALCEVTGSNIYYSGMGAKSYQTPEFFEQKGVELRYSRFIPFEYPQLWGDFEPNVSIIDFLMNCGYDWQRVLEAQNK